MMLYKEYVQSVRETPEGFEVEWNPDTVRPFHLPQHVEEFLQETFPETKETVITKLYDALQLETLMLAMRRPASHVREASKQSKAKRDQYQTAIAK